MPTGNKPKLHRDRSMDVLKMLARLSHPPLCALIGAGQGQEMMHMLKGLDRQRQGRCPKRLYCFHWEDGARVAKRMLEWQDDIKDRRRRRPRRRLSYSEIVSFVPMGEGNRDGWRAEVGRQIGNAGSPLSLVCHLGKGEVLGIKGDFAALLPLLDGSTTIAICGMNKTGPQEQFDRMINLKGWDGIRLANIGILQRRSSVKGV